MKSKVYLVLAVMALPGAVSAQTITGGLTLSYGATDGGDFSEDMKQRGLDGRMAVDFGNGVTFGVQVGKIDMNVDGGLGGLGGEFIGLDGKYRFAGGFTVGAFAEQLSAAPDGSPFDLTLKTNGLTAGYENAGLEVEAFVGNTSLSPALLAVDVKNKGLTVGYTGIAGLQLGATYLKADLSQGGGDADIDFTGIAANYAINDAMIVFGGISQSDVSSGGVTGLGFDSMGLGIGYDIGAMAGVSSTLSLEVARTELSSFGSSTDLDTVRLGVTFPLGAKGPALPMNSVADSILNPRHGALNAALTSVF